jgi:hypothetical protein
MADSFMCPPRLKLRPLIIENLVLKNWDLLFPFSSIDNLRSRGGSSGQRFSTGNSTGLSWSRWVPELFIPGISWEIFYRELYMAILIKVSPWTFRPRNFLRDFLQGTLHGYPDQGESLNFSSQDSSERFSIGKSTWLSWSRSVPELYFPDSCVPGIFWEIF